MGVSTNARTKFGKYKKILLQVAGIMKVKGIRGVAAALNIPEGTVYAWIKRGNIADVGAILSKCPNLNKEWLETGEGPIYRGSDLPGVQQFDDSVSALEDFALIPRYSVAGSAVDSEEIEEYVSFRKDWIKNSLRVKENQLAVITVKGDSMEPRLRDGDIVLLDMSVRIIEDNSIYALQFNGGLSIKRVQRFMSGAVEIISDNKTYKPEHLTPDQAENIRVIGRVVWAGGRV